MKESPIIFNTRVHDQLVRTYEQTHPEIFNDAEQKRLRTMLAYAQSFIATDNSTGSYQALDVGSGTGNLTRHLVALSFEVTSADISRRFLERIHAELPMVHLCQLNGTDLSGFSDTTFDFIATYSVLHHIPNYGYMIREMCRVLKPGGVLYIDHEKNNLFWDQPTLLRTFYQKQKKYLLWSNLRKLYNPMWYVHRCRRLIYPRYQAEGDIHVWPDDHIEWSVIETICTANGVELVCSKDFLLNDRRYNQMLYTEYAPQITDTRVAIFKKQ